MLTKRRTQLKAGNIQGNPFGACVEAIVAGDGVTAVGLLDASPLLAQARAGQGATRQAPKQNFFEQIRHYMYEGDTALHMAAAAHQTRIVDELIARGADIRAKNRRGAEPLHYAVDGGPGLSARDQTAQAKIIATLVRAGADPNAVDKSGVAPRRAQSLRGCSAGADRGWC
jgi:ankyrin repeat protein